MKFVLIGFGRIGKVHAAAIAKQPNAELVSIVDKQKTSDVNIPIFEDWGEFIKANIAADIVIIATPNGSHFEQAKKALESGFHVVVEKPITLKVSDLEKLIYIAQTNNKRLFNMLQLRFSPVVQWVKNILNEKALGEIYMVNAQCYWNRNKAYYQQRDWHGSKTQDGGVLFTQFSHFVDVLHYWFTELKPKDIRAYNFNHQQLTEFADSGIINFEIPGNGCGNLIYTTSVYQQNFESNITIIAEKGTLKISGQYMNQIIYLNAENVINPFSENVSGEFHRDALQEISKAIVENKSCILDAENARNVIQFLEVVS